MSFRLAQIVLMAVTGLSLIPLALAQEELPPPPRPYHHVTLFAGAWIEERETPDPTDFSQKEWIAPFTYGIGYEYRTSRNTGLGFFYQRTGGDIDSYLIGGGVGIHSNKGWWILIASAWERREDESNGKLRVGLNREFRLGKKRQTTITPSLYFDIGEPNFNFVLGLSVGRMF